MEFLLKRYQEGSSEVISPQVPNFNRPYHHMESQRFIVPMAKIRGLRSKPAKNHL
jgi:hypothetical protein